MLVGLRLVSHVSIYTFSFIISQRKFESKSRQMTRSIVIPSKLRLIWKLDNERVKWVNWLRSIIKRRYIANSFERRYLANSFAIPAQQAQNVCITFIQRRPNVFEIGPTLYKSYTNVVCLLGEHIRWQRPVVTCGIYCYGAPVIEFRPSTWKSLPSFSQFNCLFTNYADLPCR